MSRVDRPTLERVKDAEALAARAEAWLVEKIAACPGRCAIGLSGGSTPKRVYERLGRHAALAWGRLDFYFGDERCVAPDHPDSNFRMAREALGAGGYLLPASLHRMEAEGPDRDAVARAYEAVLPAAIDLLLLGVGEDGHTASLFPGGDAVKETARRVVPVLGAKPPPWRLSITPPVIAAARQILVLASGEGKADAVARALASAEDPSRVPSKLAARGNATWLVDDAAAAKLPR